MHPLDYRRSVKMLDLEDCFAALLEDLLLALAAEADTCEDPVLFACERGCDKYVSSTSLEYC